MAMDTMDLALPEVLKLFQRYVQYLITNDFAYQALTLVRGLSNALKRRPEITEHKSEFTQGYDNVLNLARGVALSMLTDDEIRTFFQAGIVIALRNPEIDIIAKIKTKLLQFDWLEDRDEFKKNLRQALRQNTERLTLHGLQTSIGVIAPSIREWIERAEKSSFEGEPLASAINTNQDFKQLSQEEQDVIQKLHALDDLLSLSSESPEGYESAITVRHTDGNMYVIEGGQRIQAVDEETEKLYARIIGGLKKPQPHVPIPAQTTSLPTPVQPSVQSLPQHQVDQIQSTIKKIRTTHAAADESRYQHQEQLLQQYGSNTDKIIEVLSNALLQNNSDEVVASLGVLARSGSIADALKHQKIRDEFSREFLQRLANQHKLSFAQALKAFEANPGSVAYIAGFILWSLSKALPNDAAESARIGNQIENILSSLGIHGFAGMTYFDVRHNGFRWTELRMRADGSLERGKV